MATTASQAPVASAAHHGGIPVSQSSTSGTATTAPAQKSKKAKSKKEADPSETGKLLAAKINQLELDAAGEKDQELEIGGSFWNRAFRYV